MQVTCFRIGHLMDEKTRFHGRAPRAAWGLFAAALLLLPGAGLRLQRAAAAKDAAPTTQPAAATPTAESAKAAAEAAFTRAWAASLNRTVPELTFDGVGVGDVIDFMRDVSGVNIVVDWKHAGIDRNAPITAKMRNIKFADAMRQILGQVGDPKNRPLYGLDEDVMFISTPAGVKANSDSAEVFAAMKMSEPMRARLKHNCLELTFDGVGLNDAIDYLKETGGTPIKVDWAGLKDAGVDRATPVSMKLRNIPLGQVLRLIVEGINSAKPIGITIEDDRMVIKPVAEEKKR